MKTLAICILSVLLSCTGCASNEGETYQKNLYLLDYSHSYGNKPKISAELPMNARFRPTGHWWKGDTGFKLVWEWDIYSDFTTEEQ